MTDDDGRVTLFWEGVTTTDGRRIEPGAAWWAEEPFPLMKPSNDSGSELYGKITDLRREPTGRVTCVTDPPLADDEYLAAEFDTLRGRNMGMLDTDPHTLIIQSARFRGATVVPGIRAIWPDRED